MHRSALAWTAISILAFVVVDAHRGRRAAPALADPPHQEPEAAPAPSPPAPAKRRSFRVLFVVEMVVIALGLAFLILGRAGFAGSPISYVVVSGHSMEPTFHTGDVVVLRRSSTYRKGEVIAYKVPAGGPGAGLIVIHRVVGGNAREGYLVQGDNKQFKDPWRPRPNDVVGRELAMVPKAGLAIGYVRSPLGFALVAALLTVTIALGGGDSPSKGVEKSLEPGIAATRRRRFTPAGLVRSVRAWARGRASAESRSQSS